VNIQDSKHYTYINQNRLEFASNIADRFNQYRTNVPVVPEFYPTSQIPRNEFVMPPEKKSGIGKKGLIIAGLIATALVGGVIAFIKLRKPQNTVVKLAEGFKELTAGEINILKAEIKNKSTKDAQYRERLCKGLAEHLNFNGKIDNYRLASITGSDELKGILNKLKPENYSFGGENLTNVKNGTFRASLHSHTNYSDGNTDVKTLLEQAAKYADKVHSKTGEKFVLAFTDHDTLESSKEAIKLIAQDPMKYRNLRFVPGMEKSYAHPSPKSVTGNPTEVAEFIAYSINPFCPKLNKYADELKNARKAAADVILDEAFKRQLVSKNYTYEEAKQICKDKSKHLPMDVQWSVYEYLKKNNPAKEPEINALCREYRPKVNDKNEIIFPTIYKTENTMKETINAIKDSGDGFLGLAHPAYLTYKNKGFDSPEKMIREFKQLGQDVAYAAEINYQDYKAAINDKIEPINNICRQVNLVPTGGTDAHSNNIFINKDIIPEKLRELLS
jgi:hypothetical protein